MRPKWIYVLGFFVAILPLASPLWADPPARVGRLNLINGNVSFHPGSVDQWVAAQLNYPLTTGDHLWVDNNSRAEVHVGSTQIQLAPQTDFQFLNLNDQISQIRVAQGTIELRVRFMAAHDTYEVDTPNVAISLRRPGWCRIDVDPQGNTTVTNRDGAEAEVTAGGSAFTLYANQSAQITGWDAPTYNVQPAPRLDGFDQWSMERDRREDHLASVRYVPREMVGVEDLDYYGTWRDLPGYGWGWRPTQVVVGWAPYRYGHWGWDPLYGWTWIDDAPWGFAPFHYGRWLYTADDWFWVPGPIVTPYYAPALVAFVGGRNWSVSFGLGGAGIGWFPLGPLDPYVPPYYASPAYLRVVNYNIRNIDVANINISRIHYTNFGVSGAVTVVPERAFVGSDPVNRHMMAVQKRALESASVVGMAPAVAPRPESVLAHPVGVFGGRAAAPPRAIAGRPVVVRTAPPPPIAPFSAHEKALAQHPGRPLDPQTMSRLQPHGPAAHPLVRPPAAGPAAAAGLRPARPNLPAPHPVPQPAVAAGGHPTRGPESMGAKPATPPNAPPSRAPEFRGAAPGPENRSTTGAPPARNITPRPEQRPKQMPRAAPAPQMQQPTAPAAPRHVAPPQRQATPPEMRRAAPSAPQMQRPTAPAAPQHVAPQRQATPPEMRHAAPPAPQMQRPTAPAAPRHVAPQRQAAPPEMRRAAPPAPQMQRPAAPPPQHMAPRPEPPPKQAPSAPHPAGGQPPRKGH